jgi:hypothetical protein
MSSRFDKLEVEIVDALRRAPGAEPSADLDARILARAHAAVRPARRTQPRWMSVAAGLVVLVGSGLVLRIWQQVEHAPTALDAPPATSQPAAPAAVDGGAVPDAERMDQAAPPSEADSMASMAAAGPAQERQEAANTVSTSAETRRPALLAEPEKARAQSVPATADASKPGADLARPFPAQAPAPAAAPPPPAEPAPQLAAEPAMAAPAAPPAPAPAAAAAAPAVTGAMAKSEALAQPMAEEALAGADDMVGAARSAAGTLARDAADQAIDPWNAAIDALRAARDSGDDATARRVLESLRRDFPEREIPEDLAAYADSLQ